MDLEIVPEKNWQRFVIDDREGWTASTFFSELDRIFSTIKQHVEKSDTSVVFDLTRVRRVDSSMITLLVQTIRLMDRKKITVLTPDHETSVLLSLMGIDKLAHVFSSEKEWLEQNESDD